MNLLRPIVALSAAVLVVAFAHAEPRRTALPSHSVDAWNAAKGPAAADVFRYAKNYTIVCFVGGAESKCTLASRTNQVSLFYLYTDSGPLPEYAFAVIYYSIDTGNALMFEAAIFQRSGRQGYALKRSVDGLFGVPAGVELDGKDFLVTTATLTQDDARCCPSGRTLWRVDGSTGKAKYEVGNKIDAIK